MSRCHDCKHWHLPDDDAELVPRINAGWKTCLKMAGDCLAPSQPPTLAMAYETGESETRVMTAPDFGCLMFEAKETHA